MESFVDRMPRAYSGEFRWGDGQPAQTPAITFDPVRALSDEKVEALGCAAYGHETPTKSPNAYSTIGFARGNLGRIAARQYPNRGRRRSAGTFFQRSSAD
jgi:hypothetical protein